MRKIFAFCLLFLITKTQAQVAVEAFPADPQSGPYNYFGVRVTLPYTYSQNVTVNGFVYDEGDPNTNTPFQLTVYAGYLTAETSVSFYQTCPTCTGVADMTSLVTTYAGVTITFEVNNNILKFNSISDVNSVLDQLDDDYENHYDNHDSQLDTSLSVDVLDSLDSVMGFDPFKPYKDFESLFPGYYSKRAEVESIEITWLDNDFEGTAPSAVDLTFNDAQNTIFNGNYSFKVGNDLYQLASDGMYINSTLQTMLYDKKNDAAINGKLMNDRMYSNDIFQNETYRITGPIIPENYIEYNDNIQNNSGSIEKAMTDCKSNSKAVASGYTNNNTERYELEVAIHSIVIRSGVHGKVIHFKKKNGKWKRSRTEMAAYCSGNLYNSQCTFLFSFGERKPYSGFLKREQLKAMRHTAPAIPGVNTIWKTFSGELAAGFDTPSTVSGTIILTW